jgi:hypothetical protein
MKEKGGAGNAWQKYYTVEIIQASDTRTIKPEQTEYTVN